MDTPLLLLLVFGIFLGLLLLIRLVCRFAEHGRTVKYLKVEMGRAYNEEEYRRWKDRLTVARWSFYTGLSPEFIKRRIKRRREKCNR